MRRPFLFLLAALAITLPARAQQNNRPNVIYIYADDLGYGDLGCYGTSKLATPNLDKLAAGGMRFTNAHATSGTCTPSRFALMTGQYPWRKRGTGILPGDASLIVPPDRVSLPRIFKNSGYATAIVGKWHLGLGNQVDKNWNATVKPGPNEVGFDYSFIFPATADRVPTVFMENGDVLARDPADPIAVDYKQKIGTDPTGLENPELLKMKASANHGHNNTIVNGIGRIGWMTGGHRARWVDEEISTTFLFKAREFIEKNASKPFFLFFPLTEPHVPRMPATQFKGKSGLGYRGDAILQLDWTVGQIMKQLEASGIAKNTMIIFSSDNGPVLDDGYEDGAVTMLGEHKPLGPLRGGKYSALEGGTRVPFILNWPAQVKPGVSDALVCQIDLLASFAALLNQKVPAGQATDSENHAQVFLGKSAAGRKVLVKQGMQQPTAILMGDWKYIRPAAGVAYMKQVGIESGNSAGPQLYNLKNDVGERKNLAKSEPERVKAMADMLRKIVGNDAE